MKVDMCACDGEKGGRLCFMRLFRIFPFLIPPSPRATVFSMFVWTKEGRDLNCK